MNWDTRKLPKCPRCGKDMRLDTYDKSMSIKGLNKVDVKEVREFEALLFECNCGKHILICMSGKIYQYNYDWKFYDEISIKEKVIFT